MSSDSESEDKDEEDSLHLKPFTLFVDDKYLLIKISVSSLVKLPFDICLIVSQEPGINNKKKTWAQQKNLQWGYFRNLLSRKSLVP